LYEISGAYAEVQTAVEEGHDVGDALARLTDQLEHKAAALVHIAREVELDVAKLDAEIERLTARRKTAQGHLERIKRYLKDGMEQAGITKIKAGTFSLTLSDGPERVDVLDHEKVPPAFIRTRTEETVDKRAVLAAYTLAGECVPGTEVTRSKCLRIR
jgi:chromosome segregation ATPase